MQNTNGDNGKHHQASRSTPRKSPTQPGESRWTSHPTTERRARQRQARREGQQPSKQPTPSWGSGGASHPTTEQPAQRQQARREGQQTVENRRATTLGGVDDTKRRLHRNQNWRASPWGELDKAPQQPHNRRGRRPQRNRRLPGGRKEEPIVGKTTGEEQGESRDT